MHPLEVAALIIAAVWCGLMLTWLFPLAARHWITAGLLASVQVTGTLALAASFAVGPAPVHLRWSGRPAAWPGMFAYDYAQAWGWATGEAAELFILVAVLFGWCLLRRRLHTRRRRVVEVPGPPVVVVQPWPPGPQPPWPPAQPPLHQPGIRR